MADRDEQTILNCELIAAVRGATHKHEVQLKETPVTTFKPAR